MDFLKNLMANVQHTSDSGKLDKNDAFSIGRQAVFVGLGAAVAFLSSHLVGLNLGEYTMVIVPITTVGLNALQKWIASNELKDD